MTEVTVWWVDPIVYDGPIYNLQFRPKDMGNRLKYAVTSGK